ncbi:phospho-N-acetylmuramoyl-pentapeptide-transferase [Striga asiatica]|uniref:Phospho-N-acetylmuramoyl-pentapeptide-transferase n=1 Tax=Striga asiatica TaxID=4170 RepID=A0A5A7R200_STRAF|nr:phospho-N-acetylmuramoyl-pentapeptide-transferase [Striga asiatica]
MDPLQQQQPPPVEVAQQAYRAHTAHGSVGPVIGVLALVLMLGAVAVMVGRLCSGRGIRGHAKYDFEGWVETKCASCIDGRVDPIPPPSRVVVEHRVGRASGEGGGRAAPPPEERGGEEPPSA